MNKIYIPDDSLRIETNITTDRQAYIEYETIFVSVLFLHSFNKTPVFYNPTNAPAFDIYYDLYDPFSNQIDSGEFIGKPIGPSVGLKIPLLSSSVSKNLKSGVYTLRIYGDNVAPSYKQIRVLGRGDYANDFPLLASTV